MVKINEASPHWEGKESMSSTFSREVVLLRRPDSMVRGGAKAELQRFSYVTLVPDFQFDKAWHANGSNDEGVII